MNALELMQAYYDLEIEEGKALMAKKDALDEFFAKAEESGKSVTLTFVKGTPE